VCVCVCLGLCSQCGVAQRCSSKPEQPPNPDTHAHMTRQRTAPTMTRIATTSLPPRPGPRRLSRPQSRPKPVLRTLTLRSCLSWAPARSTRGRSTSRARWASRVPQNIVHCKLYNELAFHVGWQSQRWCFCSLTFGGLCSRCSNKVGSRLLHV